MGRGGKRKRSGGPFSRRVDRRRSYAPRRLGPTGSEVSSAYKKDPQKNLRVLFVSG